MEFPPSTSLKKQISNSLNSHLLFGLLALLLVSCRETPDSQEADQNPGREGTNQDSVKALAVRHCSSCHAFVEPDCLPKSAWNEILPIMGYFLGIAEEGHVLKDENVPVVKERLKDSIIFSQKGSITKKEWIAIQQYFESNAPESLKKEAPPLSTPLSQFSYEPYPWKGPTLGLTYLSFENGVFKVGTSTKDKHALLEIADQGRVISSYEANSPVVDVIPVVNAVQNKVVDMVLQIGQMENIDNPTGQLATRTQAMQTVIAPLQRPVDFAMADFDNDGGTDILVAEFGKYLGGINVYHQKKSLVKHNVSPFPGATSFELRDVNQDGLIDFYCLTSQWNEGIYLFTNTGDLSFKSERLIEFPPHFGLVDFELVDFDNDGDEDIICSNGDSGDFTPFYKPYHGVRIFENQGQHRFVERWFHSQQGAFGTVCHDFDGDGDIDFGSIGHLASMFDEEETGFIYFENISTPEHPWSFQAHALPGVPDNCWVLIKSADLDQDGDMDIILGANTTFVYPDIAKRNLQTWAREGGVISILWNNQ